MTEATQGAIIVALISGASNILAVVAARLNSRGEHKQTAAKAEKIASEVSEIRKIVKNGNH